jgi:hypothetical protein
MQNILTASEPTQPLIQRTPESLSQDAKRPRCQVDFSRLVPRLGMSGAVTTLPPYAFTMWAGAIIFLVHLVKSFLTLELNKRRVKIS